jgi:hypothetical protein
MTAANLRSGLLVLLAFLATPGCGTVAHLRQEHREASLHREQVDEAEARDAESTTDRALKAQSTQRVTQLRRVQHELISAGTPEALAATALIERMLIGSGSAAALDLAAQAVGGAPDRAELALVQLQLCESAPGCDAAPLEAHLRQLDPRNGITWIYALSRAAKRDDGAAWQAARAGLAGSQRVDVYWNRIVAQLSGAMAGKAGFDAATAMVEMIGIEGGFAPALQPVTRACFGQAEPLPEVLAECRQIATAFRHGDTTLVEAFGTSLALRLWPADAVESRQIAQERRALRYRVDLMGRNAALLNSPQAMRALVPLLTRYPDEQGALRAQYLQLGLNPDPPAGWGEPGAGG